MIAGTFKIDIYGLVMKVKLKKDIDLSRSGT